MTKLLTTAERPIMVDWGYPFSYNVKLFNTNRYYTTFWHVFRKVLYIVLEMRTKEKSHCAILKYKCIEKCRKSSRLNLKLKLCKEISLRRCLEQPLVVDLQWVFLRRWVCGRHTGGGHLATLKTSSGHWPVVLLAAPPSALRRRRLRFQLHPQRADYTSFCYRWKTTKSIKCWSKFFLKVVSHQIPDTGLDVKKSIFYMNTIYKYRFLVCLKINGLISFF